LGGSALSLGRGGHSWRTHGHTVGINSLFFSRIGTDNNQMELVLYLRKFRSSRSLKQKLHGWSILWLKLRNEDRTKTYWACNSKTFQTHCTAGLRLA